MNTQRLATTTTLGLGFLLMLLLSNMPLPQAQAQTGINTIRSKIASSDVVRLDNAATPVYSGSGITATVKARGTTDYTLDSPYGGRKTNSGRYSPMMAHLLGAAGLADGDFENGRDGSWAEFSTHGWPIVVSSSDLVTVTPHSGSWAAWLGGGDDETSCITQSVVIPAGGPILTYWQWIGSEDICDYDWAEVVVNGDTVISYTLCSDVNTNGWVTRTVDLSAYADQTIQLQFRVETDSSISSSLFVDDVALENTSQHFVYLPLVVRPNPPAVTPTPTPTPTRTPTPTPTATPSAGIIPKDGSWTGARISFGVSGGGTHITSINLTVIDCQGFPQMYFFGGTSISGAHFFDTQGSSTISGDFTSAHTASGTYSVSRIYPCTGLPQTGYWSASTP